MKPKNLTDDVIIKAIVAGYRKNKDRYNHTVVGVMSCGIVAGGAGCSMKAQAPRWDAMPIYVGGKPLVVAVEVPNVAVEEESAAPIEVKVSVPSQIVTKTQPKITTNHVVKAHRNTAGCLIAEYNYDKVVAGKMVTVEEDGPDVIRTIKIPGVKKVTPKKVKPKEIVMKTVYMGMQATNTGGTAANVIAIIKPTTDLSKSVITKIVEEKSDLRQAAEMIKVKFQVGAGYNVVHHLGLPDNVGDNISLNNASASDAAAETGKVSNTNTAKVDPITNTNTAEAEAAAQTGEICIPVEVNNIDGDNVGEKVHNYVPGDGNIINDSSSSTYKPANPLELGRTPDMVAVFKAKHPIEQNAGIAKAFRPNPTVVAIVNAAKCNVA